MSGSAIRRQIELAVARDLAPEAMTRQLAEYARRDVAEKIAAGQFPRGYRTIVDGREGASEDTVKPGGIIWYRGAVLGQAAAYGLARLIDMSPTGPAKTVRDSAGRFAGPYREQFVLAVGAGGTGAGRVAQAERYAANRIILPDSFDPDLVGPDATEVIIVNRSPYARKVDVRLIGTQKLRFSTGREDLFDEAARAVRRRYPTLDARRIYQMEFPGQYVIKYGKKAGRRVENPALVISWRG